MASNSFLPSLWRQSPPACTDSNPPDVRRNAPHQPTGKHSAYGSNSACTNAAQDLKDEIEVKVNALLTHPKKFAQSRCVPGYRQLTVRSNYLAFYRLLSEKAPIVQAHQSADFAPAAGAKELAPEDEVVPLPQ